MRWFASRRLIGRSVLTLGILLTVAAGTGGAQQPDAAKGDLKIEGTDISRLVLLAEDNSPQEWSNLSGSISLPVGTYRARQIELQGGYVAYPEAGGDLARITISADRPAVLKAGGPLRQSVRVNRRGAALVLNYELVGIGDERYVSAGRSSPPPSFTIYRGDKAIASGQFEYG